MARELLSSDASDSEDGGAIVVNDHLKVNESFARRFEHNKKREELQKLQDKLGSTSRKRKRDGQNSDTESSSEESTSESDDEGELATENVDAEIMATINAIRSKDPRVYDATSKFYTDTEAADQSQAKPTKEKPMRLQDYHRQNLLNGGTTEEEETENIPLTYNQEQERLKKSIVGEIHAAAHGSDEEDDEESEDSDADFLIAKPVERPSKVEVTLDVDNADKDPETFLSNFMVSRAWAAPTGDTLHPFESDDDEEERRADEFEEAYNLRFEDPAKSNEKLRSHARDMAAKYSVRREEQNPRQKKRESEKEKKEAEKQQRKEDKARLRKLKIEELEEKVRHIKRAAGISTADILPEDWSRFVNDEWDDEQWDAEMQKRFGDKYYAEEDVASGDEASKGKYKLRKPKFEDDIDIKDIVPDFDDEKNDDFSLSNEEQEPVSKRKQAKKAKEERKQDSKKERRIIEQLVDDQLQLELNNSLPESSKSARFRYRETSPKSFGLSSRDILLADDKQLNEFVGLKKLASFRDAEKKRKDLKHLGKKARLRKWRLETFGNEEGVQASELIPKEEVNIQDNQDDGEGDVDIRAGGSRKKRRRKSKKPKDAGSAES
ncbi:uncharacterized protein A1O9_07548 [Exophiala aquamarina CBS 119918]|uniref:Kri1-like C-terminal domain-containing protein n=1 Tax=Exophiala aquamarina CBS 119918 TaxID=1182545 RepID=A0A072P9L0_9EURO|nr:uncharacterized protein A1O9_07548 [Exophiala aquamarina CBS 119918]KEF55968.1 hypothetical protein A1O9_07548 [Exophiala aquamarina CBS 119918]